MSKVLYTRDAHAIYGYRRYKIRNDDHELQNDLPPADRFDRRARGTIYMYMITGVSMSSWIFFFIRWMCIGCGAVVYIAGAV